jgi:hypothetical protein
MAIKVYEVIISPVGADGSAVGTATLSFPKGGFLRALSIDYQNQPVTTDILIKDSSTSGRTLFTRTNSNTDLDPTPLGMPGIDEAGAVTAATDAQSGGYPFTTGLFFDVAQADGQTSSNEKVVFKCWIER